MWTSLPTGDFFSSDNQQHRLTAGTAFALYLVISATSRKSLAEYRPGQGNPTASSANRAITNLNELIMRG